MLPKYAATVSAVARPTGFAVDGGNAFSKAFNPGFDSQLKRAA
ncbi:MAG TPA: hypothetical protein V6D50_09840 [Chroococcales cyanobacterium]